MANKQRKRHRAPVVREMYTKLHESLLHTLQNGENKILTGPNAGGEQSNSDFPALL